MVSSKASVFGLIIALIVGLLLGYAAVPEKEVTLTSTIPATTTLTSVITTTLTKTVTSRSTITKTVRETITTTATPEESSKGTQATTTSATQPSSEENYDLCTFSDYSGTSQVKLEVLKVVRGESAKDAVKYANVFNEKAPEGYEYILVNVRVTLLSGKRFSVNPFYFKMESRGRLVEPAWIVYPKNMPELESLELLPGGSTSGWLAFVIPAGAPARLHLEPIAEESLGSCQVDIGS
ncbi:MAG: DUF4352 domain-containing protein [Candidatus Korarchaeota archaeon]|nr:DUF4352 domain-containing protein [Candidatus Korarchaeota archaeon]